MMKQYDYNIVLIGFMGTGKSTIAKELARTCQMNIVEMDEEIVRREGRSIADIFAEDGEEYFRDLETALLRELQTKENQVISCGGGAVLREENIEAMKENGCVVLLTALPQTIYERVKNNTDRPILKGNMNQEYIASLMEKRRERYETAADVTVATDGKTAPQICAEILQKTQKAETLKKGLKKAGIYYKM